MCILLLPWLLEAIIVGILPTTTESISAITSSVSASGTYQLALNSYGSNTLYYYLNGTVSTTTLQNYITTQYASSGVTLSQISDDPTSVVLNLRKGDIRNTINNYYMGMELNLAAANKLTAVSYFSSMAFHSSANMLNEIDNLLLYVSTGYGTTYSISTINSPIAQNSSAPSRASYLNSLACVDSFPVTLLNFVMAVIIAIVIAFQVMHVARERNNGSKQMQMLSGIHYVTYWVANYLFDSIIMVFQCSMLIIMLAIVNAIKNNSDAEVYKIASSNLLGYAYLLLLFSCMTWCTLAYIWSFLFKADIIGFIVLLIVLGLFAFIDIVLVFVQLILVASNNSQPNGLTNLIAGIRIIFALIFPNVNDFLLFIP